MGKLARVSSHFSLFVHWKEAKVEGISNGKPRKPFLNQMKGRSGQLFPRFSRAYIEAPIKPKNRPTNEAP